MEHDAICKSCIKGKQRQKNVTKKVEFKAEKPGDEAVMDRKIITMAMKVTK